MERDIFENISPLDGRYYRGSVGLSNQLAGYLSENALIRYEARVEVALVSVMERHGIVASGAGREMLDAYKRITPEEVYKEEEKTHHNIRALVNVLQRYVSPDVAPFVHLGATSEDITATAQSLRLRDVFFTVVIPKCLDFTDSLLEIAEKEAATPQIGRTHGQHAVPITVGYFFSGYADRFGGRLLKMADAAEDLRGKLSGAVGAYNATSLLCPDPRGFEEEVLSELGLKPADFSSQIVEPEYLLDLVHAVLSAFGVLAQISDDIRNLQRTEIGEMGERFEKGQVGSSTMPHKRNPWNFEHVKSMWKEFVPRMITRYHDQISEHQRDLTNSASGRFVPEIIAAFVLSCDRLLRQFEKLVIDYEGIETNLRKTEGMFLAEPLYILLASKGVASAHEEVKQITLRAQAENKSILEIARSLESLKDVSDSEIWKALEKDPASYTGASEARTHEICAKWQERLSVLRKKVAAYKAEL
ncbi:MAG: adenylosuccinate lyase [Spirochaetes bacterium]|nr:adenylosuccinate lyase [Spirochaetota bacterium]